jgi:hypothetical protein
VLLIGALIKERRWKMVASESGIDYPHNITEQRIADIPPIVHESADGALKEIREWFDPKQSADAQLRTKGERAVGEILHNLSLISTPETKWQSIWMTILRLGYEYGVSRAKNEGGQGKASELGRLMGRVAEGYIIEEAGTKIVVEGCSAPIDRQKPLLRGTLRFAIAAGELAITNGTYKPYPNGYSVDVWQESMMHRDEIIQMVDTDLQLPPANQKYSGYNL